MSALWLLVRGNWLTILRDAAILGLLGFVVWRIYTDGENSVKAGDLKSLQAEVKQQGETASRWREGITNAQTQLSADMAHITAAPVVEHQWMREPTACPQSRVLPTTPAQAGDEHPDAGAVRPGDGELTEGRRRDAAVADFKARWKIVLAQCRALDSSWPQ